MHLRLVLSFDSNIYVVFWQRNYEKHQVLTPIDLLMLQLTKMHLKEFGVYKFVTYTGALALLQYSFLKLHLVFFFAAREAMYPTLVLLTLELQIMWFSLLSYGNKLRAWRSRFLLRMLSFWRRTKRWCFESSSDVTCKWTWSLVGKCGISSC